MHFSRICRKTGFTSNSERKEYTLNLVWMRKCYNIFKQFFIWVYLWSTYSLLIFPSIHLFLLVDLADYKGLHHYHALPQSSAEPPLLPCIYRRDGRAQLATMLSHLVILPDCCNQQRTRARIQTYNKAGANFVDGVVVRRGGQVVLLHQTMTRWLQ